tara:strand:+ start:172 stop:546 length:375 start_codon:yes stop_codon:yes gene_type:complete
MAKAMAKISSVTPEQDREAPFSSCPVDNALKLISGKWKPRILYRLSLGTQRFGELQRSIPEVTQRMLTLQLRELERDGLIKRKVYAEVPPKVEYSLTKAARNMGPILLSFGNWFDTHASELLNN